MQNLQKKLDNMMDNSYMLNTIVYKVLKYKISEDKFELVTDKKWFEFKLEEADKLNEFLPVEDEKLPAVINNSVLYNQIKDDLPNLTDIIKDNITKLQSNKEYISQATAINESINSLINLVKLEIMVKKLNKR